MRKSLRKAFNTGNKKLFEKLLNQNPESIEPYFYPEDGDLCMWDLFHRLDPKDYANKSFNDLTAYEKLYVQLYDRYFALELSHRLNLRGKVALTYDDQLINDIKLDGQPSGFGVMQLKDHLLEFSAQNTGNLSQGFHQALNDIIPIKPQASLHANNHKLNSDLNLFIFNHVNHAWCSLLTQDKLYLINMGLGSDKTPGIHIYDVPKSKRKHIFNYLKHLENTTLEDQITQGLNEPGKEIDWDKYREQIINRYEKMMNFDHFKNLAKKFNLKELEYIAIPPQETGNCSYYSLKGIFFALLYHYNQKHHPKAHAYKQSLNDFLAFVRFDYNKAIDHYKTHALRPNIQLLHLANHKLNKENASNTTSAFKKTNYKRRVF